MGTHNHSAIIAWIIFTCTPISCWTPVFFTLDHDQQRELGVLWTSLPTIYDDATRQTSNGIQFETALHALKKQVLYGQTPRIKQWSAALSTIGEMYDHLIHMPLITTHDAACLVASLYDFFDLLEAAPREILGDQERHFIAYLHEASHHAHNLLTSNVRGAAHTQAMPWYMILLHLSAPTKTFSYIPLVTSTGHNAQQIKFIPGLESLITGGVGQILQGLGSALPHIIGPLVTLATAGFAFYQFKHAIDGPQNARRTRLKHMHKRDMERIHHQLSEISNQAQQFQKNFNRHVKALRNQLRYIQETNKQIATIIEQDIAPQSLQALQTIRRIRKRNEDTHEKMAHVQQFIEQKMLQHKCPHAQG